MTKDFEFCAVYPGKHPVDPGKHPVDPGNLLIANNSSIW